MLELLKYFDILNEEIIKKEHVMSTNITRRSFIKRSTAIGVSSVLGSTLVPNITSSNESIDMAVVKGQDYFENTIKAVELLGGIKKFVPQN